MLSNGFWFFFQGNIMVDCSWGLLVVRQGAKPSMTCV